MFGTIQAGDAEIAEKRQFEPIVWWRSIDGRVLGKELQEKTQAARGHETISALSCCGARFGRGFSSVLHIG